MKRIPRLALAFPWAALVLLSGCTSVAEPPGLYIFDVTDGATSWIGQPVGLASWSPKSAVLAWASEDGLTLFNSADESTRNLVNARIAGRPAWSPDGSAIAFLDEDALSLTVVDAASGKIELQIPVATEPRWSGTADLLSWGGPAWSPDGRRIAFACWDGAGDELCVVGSHGEQLRQVTRLGPSKLADTGQGSTVTATSNVGPPSWSPDGRSIALAAYPERSGAPSGVFVVSLDAGSARQAVKLLPNSDISWSPDGTWLYFSATEKGRSDIVRVSAKDGSSKKLSSALPGGARSPALSADGKRIAAISQGLLVILDEGNAVMETASLGLKEGAPAWNAEGNAVAFSAREDPIAKYD